MRGLSSHGYVRVNLADGSRAYAHNVVAQRVLGRALKVNEVVRAVLRKALTMLDEHYAERASHIVAPIPTKEQNA